MASENPPPYFPQSSLAPPDPKRYQKFKMIIAVLALVLVLVLVAVGAAVYYLIRSLY